MIEYDPHRWRDFFRIGGHMSAAISKRAGWILAWGIAVTIAHHFFKQIEIRNDAHVLIGPALSLLLVFRTNSSYDRFWEGRKLWGTIVNTTRGLARACSVHFAANKTQLQRITDLVAEFPFATMNELRGVKQARAPMEVSRDLTQALNDARRANIIGDFVFVQLDQMNQTLVDCFGACERIHKTPLPFAYVMHLRRAIILYCATLPFALIERFGYATAIVSFLIALILLGIEEIGVEIEDPFGTDDNDLPLEQICNNIERNVRAITALS